MYMILDLDQMITSREIVELTIGQAEVLLNIWVRLEDGSWGLNDDEFHKACDQLYDQIKCEIPIPMFDRDREEEMDELHDMIVRLKDLIDHPFEQNTNGLSFTYENTCVGISNSLMGAKAYVYDEMVKDYDQDER